MPGFIAILCAVYALSRLPAATFPALAYFEPIAVVVFGWTLFGETLSALQLAGCLVIIAGGVFTTWLAAGVPGKGLTASGPAGRSGPPAERAWPASPALCRHQHSVVPFAVTACSFLRSSSWRCSRRSFSSATLPCPPAQPDLFLFSLAFFYWGEHKYIGVLLAFVAINYLFGLLVGRAEQPERRKLFLGLGIAAN